MKNKRFLKRLMVLGLACSLTMSMAPAAVYAAESEMQTERKQDTEKETVQQTEMEIPKETEPRNEMEIQPEITGQSGLGTQSESESVMSTENRTVRATSVGPFELTGEGLEEGVDYHYEIDSAILTILSNKKMVIVGNGSEAKAQIVVDAEQAELTMENVQLNLEESSVLIVNAEKKAVITLTGSSKLTTEKEDTPAVRMRLGSELTFEGEGKLTITGHGTGKDIVMSIGNETEDVPSSLIIKDGTLKIANGISVSGTNTDKKAKVQILGGSVEISGSDSSKLDIFGTEERQKVYKTELTLEDADKQVENLTVSINGTAYTYENSGIYTNSDKKVFLYLPAGSAAVQVGEMLYTGTVGTSGTNRLTKATAVLSVDSVTIPNATYGYTPAAANLVIKNTAAAATTVQAVLSGTDADKFVVTTPTNQTVPAGTEAAPGRNEAFTIQPRAGLNAGTYQATLIVTGAEGSPVTTTVSFTVDKAVLIPTAQIEDKVFDDTRTASGTVTLTGAVGSESPQLKNTVSYQFNSKKVKNASFVTISGLELEDAYKTNYELERTQFRVNASIEKAPNEKESSTPRKSTIRSVYDSTKQEWHLEMTTYEGQEYLFFGENVTKLTNANLKSDNWVYGTKSTVTNRTISLKVTEGTTYTVWTRYAGDDNHEAGTKLANMSVTVKQSASAKTYNTSDNKITGLVSGTTYKTNSVLAFKAEGAGMDNTSPVSGDERYLPISWRVSESHTWTAAPYEASFKMPTAGSYTLQVTFRKQTYDGSKWNDTTSTGTTRVSFKVAANGTDGTGVQLSNSTTRTTSSTSAASRTNSAAKTDDATPILPMMMIFGASIVVIAGYLVLRKRKKA